jgi:hypothetical protein
MPSLGDHKKFRLMLRPSFYFLLFRAHSTYILSKRIIQHLTTNYGWRLKIYTIFSRIQENLIGLAGSTAFYFAEDKQKRVWIGCNNRGLFTMMERNKIYPVSTNNNIASSMHHDNYVSVLPNESKQVFGRHR